jgi:hypothetical protein
VGIRDLDSVDPALAEGGNLGTVPCGGNGEGKGCRHERVLPSHYEQYITTLSGYVSVPVYSNDNTFNSFIESAKVENMTFNDTYEVSKSVILVCVVNSALLAILLQ